MPYHGTEYMLLQGTKLSLLVITNINNYSILTLDYNDNMTLDYIGENGDIFFHWFERLWCKIHQLTNLM